MFFLASKVAWYLVQPLVVILVLLGAGLLGFGLRLPRLAVASVTIATLALAVFSLSPLGLLMMSLLEDRFPKPQLPGSVAGIVVLGGSFDTRVARTRQEAELNDAGDRVTAAMALSRRYPEAKILFSGGSAAVFAEDISEAAAAEAFFLSLGLSPDRLLLEDRSRNTFENAVFSRELADPQPGETWLLVTSAYHIPRSVGCFRRAGFAVVPYPVDYQTPSGYAIWTPSSASIRNVEKVHFAIREYLGLAAYWMTGKTDALFPRPAA